MPEQLQEFISSRGHALRVDREAGVIRGVKILGLESQNGRTYQPTALQNATALYEGAKVNVNHPKTTAGAPRDYQDRLGAIHNVVVRTQEGLFADLHFNPQHALAGQLLWDAEHAPENVGFSHNVLAKTQRRGDRVVVEAILKVQSVDLVADPATTRGLFEAAAEPVAETTGDVFLWEELCLAELTRRRPDLIEAVAGKLHREMLDLRRELDARRAADAIGERRDLARRLLVEADLPDPLVDGSWAREIVSEAFYASLLAAADETEMRALVQERAQLIHAAAGLARDRRPFRDRPRARDQQLVEAGGAAEIDAAAFARSIS